MYMCFMMSVLLLLPACVFVLVHVWACDVSNGVAHKALESIPDSSVSIVCRVLYTQTCICSAGMNSVRQNLIYMYVHMYTWAQHHHESSLLGADCIFRTCVCVCTRMHYDICSSETRMTSCWMTYVYAQVSVLCVFMPLYFLAACVMSNAFDACTMIVFRGLCTW